jgi:hypothetical protein
MASTRIERADIVVGKGSTVVAAGAYKDAEEKTRYKFGICFDRPGKEQLGEELWDKFASLGIHRAMSVDAAGTFNKGSDFGTEADAEAFAARWGSVEGCAAAFEKAARAEKAPRIRGLADEVNSILFEAVCTNFLGHNMKALTKEQTKEISGIVKEIKAGTHEKKAWLEVATNKAKAEIERRSKAVSKDFA